MLDFYLGDEGVDNLGEHIGALSPEEIFWLQQNGFLVKGATGHYPDDKPESLPPGDDVTLTCEQVENMFNYYSNGLIKAERNTDFNDDAVNGLKHILTRAIQCKSGISTVAD